MTLQDLTIKYPTVRGLKYEPTENCKFCNGTGESPEKVLPSGRVSPVKPCACVFMGEHAPMVLESLSKIAKQMRKDLGT